MTYFDSKKEPTNKIKRINTVGDDNAEMANKVVYESMYNTTS